MESSTAIASSLASPSPSPKPWEGEPDWLRFRHLGLRCYIIRHRRGGHLCGYVEVPRSLLRKGVKMTSMFKLVRSMKGIRRYDLLTGAEMPPEDTFRYVNDHKWERKKKFKAINPEREFSVHGGVTWFGTGIRGKYGRIPGVLVGFDCAHGGDLTPSLEQFDTQYGMGGTYRTFEYVRNQCELLAAQIAVLKEQDK